MKWSLSLFLLSCVPADAATYVLTDGFGSSLIVGAPPGVPSPARSEKLFTYDISDRTGLIPGASIVVTFSPQNFPAMAYQLWVQSNGTMRSTYTITAVLGGQTASIVSDAYVAIFDNTPNPNAPDWKMKGGHAPGIFPGEFSLTVPWETDLTALSVTVFHDVTFDGAGNGILVSGSGGYPLIVTTQTVPEPGAGLLAVAAGTLAATRRRRGPQRENQRSAL